MIDQNPDRYRREGDEVVIAAGGPPPLRIRLSPAVTLDPVLAAEGVIIRCRGRYLVGPKTAAELAATRERDPHYWYAANGPITVKGIEVGLGKTVPIIDVVIEELETIADRQGFALRTAGVTEVDWSYDDPGVIPQGVLDQINWTVSPDAPRPADRWRLAELALNADYSYETLKIAAPSEEGGRIDYEAIGEIVRRVSERLVGLRDDFNTIVDVHTGGIIPDGVASGPLQVAAITEVPPADPGDYAPRVQKRTRVLDVDPGPTDRQNAGLDAIAALRTGPGEEATPRPANPAEEESGGRRRRRR